MATFVPPQASSCKLWLARKGFDFSAALRLRLKENRGSGM